MGELASPERYHEANHDGAFESCRRCQQAKAICRSKRLYGSYEAADVAVMEINEASEYRRPATRYRCRWCLLWHVTTARTKVRVKRAERQRRKWIIARRGRPMADEDHWIKSSRCQEGSNCVEVAAPSSVKVRDRYGKVIEVDRRSWQLFIDEVCRG